MTTLADPEELAAAALVHARIADELADALGALDPGAIGWLVTRAVAVRTAPGLLGVGSANPWAVARAAEEIQTLLALIVVRSIAEEQRLRTLAARVRLVARVQVEVEASVSRALDALNRSVHDHPDRLERIVELGHRFALRRLLDGGERIDVLSEGSEDIAALRPTPTRPGVPPSSLVDLVSGDVEVATSAGAVRVTEIVRADGTSAWVVQISGTQQWWPRAGANPFDVTTDVRAVAGESTTAAVGVHLALLHAQRSTGRDTSTEPVLLSGHSLGGILAASVAAEPSFRHGRNVVGVVTAGSPIARAPIPQSVSVVALEHTNDPVPRLDGRPNPPRSHWSTVQVTPDRSRTGGRGAAAHDGGLYVESAQRVASAAAESLQREPWEEVIDPFVRGSGRSAVVHDFTLTREWQNPRS
jgi:hypothetical protein